MHSRAHESERAADLGLLLQGGQWVDPSERYCGDCREEHDDCTCDQEAFTVKIVTARKGRYEGTYGEIKPGDKVQVTSGFNYQKNGPRTGYMPKTYLRVCRGPAWTVNPTIGQELGLD